MTHVPKQDAAFHPIWNCLFCNLIIARDTGDGIESIECENCNEGNGPERMEAWLMTPDLEDERIGNLRRMLEKYEERGEIYQAARTRTRIEEIEEAT